MCFSLKRKESKKMRNQYKDLLEKRRKFTQQTEVASFLLWMIRFMEAETGWWLGISNEKSKQGICSDKKSLNVRSQFVKAFQSCSVKQQMQYYQATVKYLTQRIQRQNNGEMISFGAETQGFIKWNKGINMKLFPNEYKLEVECPLNEKKQMHLNLRNYLFRKSKQARQYTYVLEAINSTQPDKITFAILSGNRSQKQIAKVIRETNLKAYCENVIKWRQQIVHIKVKNINQPFCISQSSISVKRKKQKQEENDIWRQIDNKFIKQNEEQNQRTNKRDEKNIPYEPIIASLLDKVKAKQLKKIEQRKIEKEQNQQMIKNYHPQQSSKISSPKELDEKSFHSIEGSFESK